MWLLTTLLLLAYTIPPIISWSMTSPWHNPFMPDRDDLNCDDYCLTHNRREDLLAAGIDPRDDCCKCRSGSTWHNNPQQLFVETVSITGTNLVLNQSAFYNGTFYHIEYSYKQLREFPSNLCTSNRMTNCFTSQFSDIQPFLDNIMKIDFSDNEITDIDNLNCLTRLDILDLRNNHIAIVSNTSFNNLSYLRELYLQNNLIKHMDLAVVSGPKLNILIVDVSKNQLEELDITNMMSQKPFCVRTYSSNNVTNLVNKLNFKLDMESNVGAGFVSLQGNNLQIFPDFKELLNLDSLQELGKLISFGFDFRGIPLECDCNLGPFMGLAKDEIANLWQDYLNISCDAPPNMKGVAAQDFISNITNLDRLVCDVSSDPDCPDKCSCVDQPSQNRLLINCSGKGLKKLPDTLPQSKFSNTVNIDLSNNDITTLANVSYLPNITHISLANNNLQRIDSDAAYLLSNVSVMDLGGNPHLKKLPSELQYRKNGTIILANNTLDCDCDSKWMQNWTQNSRSSFLCRVPGHGVMPPSNFSTALLDCDQTVNKLIVLSILLGIAALTLIIAGLVSYWLRYEIYILLVRAKQVNKNAILPMLHYDAYLSFDEENDDLRVWAHKILVHQLEKIGYKLFVPLRDLQYGDVRQLNTIDILQKTKNFLLILSESYTTQDHDSTWQHREWQYSWNMFKASRMKNIVMINYDQILASEVPHPQIKAFLRVGNPVDFTNTKRDILQQICQRLGPPNKWHSEPNLVARNKKAVMQVDQLFLTHTVRQEQDTQRQERHKLRQELNKERQELDRKRQELNQQRQELDNQWSERDNRGIRQAIPVAMEDKINIECIENKENGNDQNKGGEDLEMQKQELDKQRKELDQQIAEIDKQLNLNEDDHINQVFAGNIADGNEGFKRGQHLEMTAMGKTAKAMVANNRFKTSLGTDVKKRFDRKVSDDSGMVLDEKCELKSRFEADVSTGNILVTERPRPTQGPYKYYV